MSLVDQGFCVNIIKDDRVWFDDGDLVVLVGPECEYGKPLKGDVYAFKPSRDFLSKHGHIFASAFRGQGGDPSETIEGVQYVIMPDRWEDMRDFMRMIHGFSFDIFACVGLFDAQTTQALIGPLRLSKKYGLEENFQHLVAILERDWPASYEEWFQPRHRSRSQWERESERLRQSGASPNEWISANIGSHYPDPALAIRLAHELDITSVLHAAFYDLNSIFYAPSDPVLRPEITRTHRYTEDANIGLECYQRFISGRERMRSTISTYLEDHVDAGCIFDEDTRYFLSISCVSPKKDGWRVPWGCADAVKQWQIETYHHLRGPWCTVLQDPAGEFRRLADQVADMQSRSKSLRAICPHCRGGLVKTLQSHSRIMWDLVPGIFRLK